MLLSIVIPAYNEEKTIRSTIEKIKKSITVSNLLSGNWELIVCNNNSSDKTTEVAKKLGAKIVLEPINQISRARNTGASIAKGEWLLFIDADTYPNKLLMEDVFNIINSDIYIGCGTTVNVIDGSLFNKLRMERLNPFFRLFNFSGGAFLLCHKNAFEAIRGFATHLYAYEEFDFISRLKKYGKKIGKKFIVLHKNPVFTSGRKGEYQFSSLLILFSSNIVAIFLFTFQFLIPKSISKKIGSGLLGYWYKNRG